MAVFTLAGVRLEVVFNDFTFSSLSSADVSPINVELTTRGEDQPFFQYQIESIEFGELPVIEVTNSNITGVRINGASLDLLEVGVAFGNISSSLGTTTAFSFFFENGLQSLDFLVPLDGVPLPDVATPDEIEAFVAGATFSSAGGAFGEGETINLASIQNSGLPEPEPEPPVVDDPDDENKPTEQADNIAGGGNDDVIDAKGGDDTVSGGGGSDSLSGGGGSDELQGGGGKDTLLGGGGADTLDGNGGKDLLIGNGGSDVLNGGGGKDVLQGGGGKDFLDGGGGKDLLQGGGGKDTLDGGGGKDTMEGGGGKDVIFGGRGSDILTGNGGKDRFVFDTGNGRDTISDFQQGRDKIVIEGGAVDFDALQILQFGEDVRIRIGNTIVTVEDDDAGNFTASDFIF